MPVRLANFGDSEGEQRSGRPEITCPPSVMRRAAALAQELFSDLDLLEPTDSVPPIVALNHPFPGGYILHHYHARLRDLAGRYVPSIMIEVNRGLFVGNQTAGTPITPMNERVVAAIRRRLYQWTLALLSELSPHVSTGNTLESDLG